MPRALAWAPLLATISTYLDAGVLGRWPAITLALSATCGYVPLAQADTWQRYEVSNRLGAIVGHGIELRGVLNNGHDTRAVFLASECVDGRTIIRIEVRRYDFGVWPALVRWQVDHGIERVDTWHPCDDGTCVGLWEGQGKELFRTLGKASSLSLRIEGRYAKPMTAKFNLQGANDEIRSASQQCGWI